MRRRRAVVVFVLSAAVLIFLGYSLPSAIEQTFTASSNGESEVSVSEVKPNADDAKSALAVLETLPVKGRAPKTGYARAEFGEGWSTVNGCSTRNIILNRDLENVVLQDACTVASGILHDPYTGETIQFTKEKSAAVQIDHVIALSDAWQKGAQQLTKEQRMQLANDPLELLAVDGPANQQKSDSDAASWLPKYKPFRCTYVARQIAVKVKYSLWVTQPERDAMRKVLVGCPDQRLPVD